MALIQLSFMSNALWRSVPVQVILPVDKWSSDGTLSAPKKFKTLYLFHGLMGSSVDWVTGTRIQRWAEERDLAVVMPSGDNSFYVDRPESNNRYGEFVGRELVEITRRMFPLSDRREDTFIGGLSMGGFGAMRNGLKYSDTFGSIVCLSGALHLFEDPNMMTADNAFVRAERAIFGDFAGAKLDDRNPRVAMEKLLEKRLADPAVELPGIYIACGTEDSLLKWNRLYRDLLIQKGFQVSYKEAPGVHNWDFWDTYILDALDWLPLSERTQGIGSGNVVKD